MGRRIKILLTAGLLLVAVSIGLTITDFVRTAAAGDRAAAMAAQLKSALPPRTAGITDTSTADMPVWQWEGQDVVALLEIPAYEVQLPVGAEWDAAAVAAYPRRFSGTTYGDALIIGGSDRRGQLDCLDSLDVEDVVTVTDMRGVEFTYVVDRVERSTSAAASVLSDGDASLTLFVRDALSMEYILVRCK